MLKTKIFLTFLFLFIYGNHFAQKDNKIGVGYNLSFTKGYSAHLLGLKLYYERLIFSNFSFKGNIDLILPDELGQLPIETSILYNVQGKQSYNQFFVGVGAGYYLLSDNKSSANYYYENNINVTYTPFDEGVLGIHAITGFNDTWENISFEIKYVLLSVDQNEILYYPEPSNFTKKRIKKINLNTLRMSVSYYFDL